MDKVPMYTIYLAISLALVAWVGRVARNAGNTFLVDAFRGNKPVAESVNLLRVRLFHVLAMAFVLLILKSDALTVDSRTVVEELSVKVGIVLLMLGMAHFFNVFLISNMRRRALEHRASERRAS